MSEGDDEDTGYDFGDWNSDDKPEIDELLDKWLRDNLRAAFKMFERGRWGELWDDGVRDGRAFKWISAEFPDDQPASIIFTPAELNEALLGVMNSRVDETSTVIYEVQREEIAELLEAVQLWRDALDVAEAKIRRGMALPVRQHP